MKTIAKIASAALILTGLKNRSLRRSALLLEYYQLSNEREGYTKIQFKQQYALIILAVVLIGVLWSAESLAENLVHNGNFEDGQTSWNGGMIDSNAPHGGVACLRIEDNAPDADVYAETKDIIPISRDQVYRLEVWIRGEEQGQQALVTLRQFDANNSWIYGNNMDFKVTVGTQWTRFYGVIRNFNSSTAGVKITLRPVLWSDTGHLTGTAWFDDVQFLTVETPTGGTVRGNWVVDAGSVAIWRSPIEQKVRPGMTLPGMSLPPGTSMESSVNLSGAGGEAEAFQLVLLPKKQNESLEEIKFPEIDGPGGFRLPAKIFSEREVAYVEVTRPTDYASFTGWVPDPLPPLEPPLNLENTAQQRHQQPLWFTVKVPPGTPAGVYTGTLRLRFAIGGWVSVPLRLRVWGFDLPQEHHVRTSYGLSLHRIDQYHNLDGDRDKRRKVFQLYLQDFAEHRISPTDPFGDDLWLISYSDSTGQPLMIWNPNGGIIEVDPDDPTGANHAMKVEDDRTDKNVSANTPPVLPIPPIQNRTDYRLSIWVKTDDPPDFLIVITQYNTTGEWIPHKNIALGPKDGKVTQVGGNWKQWSFDILESRFTSQTTMVGFKLHAVNYTDPGDLTGTAWFDNLVFEPVSGAGDSVRDDFDTSPPVKDIQVQVGFSAFDLAASYALDNLGFNAFRLIPPGFASGFQDDFSPGRILNFRWGTDEYKEIFEKGLLKVTNHLANYGWLERAYAYWYDEPTKNRYDKVVEGMSLLGQVEPRLKRLLTVNNEFDNSLVNNVDIWVPLLNNSNQTWVKDRQDAGDEMWWYVCTGPKAPYPNNFIDHPGIEHRIRYWMAWHFGIEGSLYWSTNYYRSDPTNDDPLNNDPWTVPMSVNDKTGKDWGNGDGRLLYPPEGWTDGKERIDEGPTPSIRWELIREGLEDYEYFWMLNQAANELETWGTRPDLVAQARQLLEISPSIMSSLIDYTGDPEQLAIRRGQIAETLEDILQIPDYKVDFDDTGRTQIPYIKEHRVTGAMMDEMLVTTQFSDYTSETLSWTEISQDSGGVFGTGWALMQSGDTFGGLWTLKSLDREIRAILIDASEGACVFDTDFGDQYGTEGSYLGWTFDVQSASPDLEIEVTYYDMVALSGHDPLGDIYRYLLIEFTNPGGFAAGDTLTFIADTDMVPESSTLLLLGFGLIGVLALRWRRFRK